LLESDKGFVLHLYICSKAVLVDRWIQRRPRQIRDYEEVYISPAPTRNGPLYLSMVNLHPHRHLR